MYCYQCFAVLKKIFLLGTKMSRLDPDPVGSVSQDYCSGSMSFWYRSLSADPYLCLVDPDQASDPALFVRIRIRTSGSGRPNGSGTLSALQICNTARSPSLTKRNWKMTNDRCSYDWPVTAGNPMAAVA
jgi:hypothetical protein